MEEKNKEWVLQVDLDLMLNDLMERYEKAMKILMPDRGPQEVIQHLDEHLYDCLVFAVVTRMLVGRNELENEHMWQESEGILNKYSEEDFEEWKGTK